MDKYIYGINSVKLLLIKHPNYVKKIIFWGKIKNPRLNELIKLARKNFPEKIKIMSHRHEIRDEIRSKGQGVYVELKRSLEQYYIEFEDFIHNIQTNNRYPNPVLIIDHITDPQNLGSIIRSAACFGVEIILIPQDRQVQLSSIVAKVANGGLEFLKMVRIVNVAGAIKQLKELGYIIMGADINGDDINEIRKINAPMGLVMGNEEKGLKLLTKKKCDKLIKIPMEDSVGSLNVSIATGIFLSYIYINKFSC